MRDVGKAGGEDIAPRHSAVRRPGREGGIAYTGFGLNEKAMEEGSVTVAHCHFCIHPAGFNEEEAAEVFHEVDKDGWVGG